MASGSVWRRAMGASAPRPVLIATCVPMTAQNTARSSALGALALARATAMGRIMGFALPTASAVAIIGLLWPSASPLVKLGSNACFPIDTLTDPPPCPATRPTTCITPFCKILHRPVSHHNDFFSYLLLPARTWLVSTTREGKHGHGREANERDLGSQSSIASSFLSCFSLSCDTAGKVA